jgi:hypothetical protein
VYGKFSDDDSEEQARQCNEYAEGDQTSREDEDEGDGEEVVYYRAHEEASPSTETS